MSTLYKKMLIIDRVFTTGWNRAREPLHNAFKKGYAELIEAEWGWDYKNKNLNYYPLDFTKSKIWSSYDSGVDVSLKVKDKRIIAELVIYECESFGGERKGVRIKAKFHLKAKGLKEFRYAINRKFEYHLEDIFEVEEELRKKERIKEIEIFSQM